MTGNDDWLAKLLAEETGFDPAVLGETHLQSALRSRMSLCHLCETEAYRRFLCGNLRERAALIAALTIPETWFFREPGAFAVMVREVAALPHPPRILCAPCSSGEEAVSAAIALLNAGITQFSIEGIDLCSSLIEKAEGGLYDPRSFRGDSLPPEQMPTYFQMHDEMTGTYRTTEIIRRHLAFRCANLHYAYTLSSAEVYDVIFCRNLMIYLREDARTLLLRRLCASLRPAGILFTGHAESSCAGGRGLQSLPDRGAFALRKVAEENAHV